MTSINAQQMQSKETIPSVEPAMNMLEASTALENSSTVSSAESVGSISNDQILNEEVIKDHVMEQFDNSEIGIPKYGEEEKDDDEDIYSVSNFNI